MANISPVIDAIESLNERGCHIIIWETLTAANAVGDAVALGGSPDRSVQVVGTFDGATVKVQGSNDGTNWVDLTDPQGNPISKTATFMESIMEISRHLRIFTSGGGASQDLDAYVFTRGG